MGSEEIIHRNNICLLSVIQSADGDPSQDGTPILPTEDEPSPLRGGLAPQGLNDYPMGNTETNIPGLSQPIWGMQQQQQPQLQQQQPQPQAAHQHPAGSLPMQTPQSYLGHGAGGNEAYQQQYQNQGASTYTGTTPNPIM